METVAFKACSRIITDKLDVKAIVPELYSHHLLTTKDYKFLINPAHEDYDKILYILHWLPRKADGWFNKFLDCLRNTSAYTGHGIIADFLSEKLKTQNGDSAPSVSHLIQLSSVHDKEVQTF